MDIQLRDPSIKIHLLTHQLSAEKTSYAPSISRKSIILKNVSEWPAILIMATLFWAFHNKKFKRAKDTSSMDNTSSSTGWPPKISILNFCEKKKKSEITFFLIRDNMLMNKKKEGDIEI